MRQPGCRVRGVPRGHHDGNGGEPRVGAHGLDQSPPIDDRHHRVCNDDAGGLVRAQPRERDLAAKRTISNESGAIQIEGQRIEQRRLVVDDEHPMTVNVGHTRLAVGTRDKGVNAHNG